MPLLDTHLLLWAATGSPRLPLAVRDTILKPEAELTFSVASIWEIAIKQSQGRRDFDFDTADLRAGLLGTGYSELPVLGMHGVVVATIPPLHRDPFDRMLLAQAMVEGLELWTVDTQLARYPGPIRVF
jgi:PIN domain nuclease of toxin-antitoxin system